MSRPKKYLTRAVVAIAVEDAAGRELVHEVNFPGGYDFSKTRDEAVGKISGEIDRGFRDLERALDVLVVRGVASPVDSFRRRKAKTR